MVVVSLPSAQSCVPVDLMAGSHDPTNHQLLLQVAILIMTEILSFWTNVLMSTSVAISHLSSTRKSRVNCDQNNYFHHHIVSVCFDFTVVYCDLL